MAPPGRRRRSAGEGGIVEYKTTAGTRYAIKYNVTQPDGTIKQVLRRRGPDGEVWTTRKAAAEALRTQVGQVDRGEWSEPSKMPLGAYLDQWLAGLRLARSTTASYRRNMRLHIVPHLGAVPLQHLTGTRITAVYRQLETTGNRRGSDTGGPLSAKTVRYVHTILRAALAAAVDAGELPHNPADKAKPPSAREARSPEMTAWTADQLRAFLDWAREHQPDLAPLWHALAYTGGRRGEVLALRWRDIDLDAGRLSILRSVGVVHDGPGAGKAVTEGDTKNARPRVIDLDEDTVAVLRAHRRDRGAVSLDWVRPDAVVFGGERGAVLHPERVSEWFGAAAERCRATVRDLPSIRLHDLRHTHATAMLAAGVPVKVVSERLGHSGATVTMGTYAHVMPGMQRQAAQAFATLLRGPGVSAEYQKGGQRPASGC